MILWLVLAGGAGGCLIRSYSKKVESMALEIQIKVKQINDSASEGSARNHRVKCDRPEIKGGHNDGPMGGELFLLGLGGCFMSNLLAAVQAREVTASNLEVCVAAQLDGTPPRFTEIDLQVSGDYHDVDEMKKLLVIAERGCIVANTIKDSVILAVTLKS